MWTLGGLTTYYVLFFIELETRRVHLPGVTLSPNDFFMGQAAEKASQFLRELVRTPREAPNANAYAERFARSIKEECPNRMIFFGEGHLRHAIEEYLAHYHGERNLQGLANELIDGGVQRSSGEVVRHERLGGLLSFYEHAT